MASDHQHRTRLARLGEAAAAEELERRGYRVLARNYRCREGEADLVADDGEDLVFVEVKTRASREFGDPWEFVDWPQQQSLRRTAEEFIVRYDLGEFAYRFDIVSVVAPGTSAEEIRILRNAF